MSYSAHSGYNSGQGGYSSNYGNSASYNSNTWGPVGGTGQYNPYRPPLPQSNSDRYNPYGGTRGQPPPPGMEPGLGNAHHRLQQPPPPPPAPAKRPAFKLRRSIQPRPVLSILNELAGPDKPNFEYLDVPMVERERRAWQSDIPVQEVGEYECKCQIGELEFIAEGHTKPEARAAVAELSVQGMIAHKCELNDTEGVGNSEDNCPWSAIASLALHKLYTDWQSQGYTVPPELITVPDFGPPSQTAGLPVIHTVHEPDKNPLQKLNEMANKVKLTLDFELTGEVGTPNDKVFTMSVCVGDRTYSGQGKNKKAARHAAASAALEEQQHWYKEDLQEEEQGGEEEQEQEQEQEDEPPEKRRNVSEGDGEPSDKGKLPGSYPGNVTE